MTVGQLQPAGDSFRVTSAKFLVVVCRSSSVVWGWPPAFSDLLCESHTRTHTHTHARTHRGSPLKGHKVKLKINQKQNGGRGAQIDVDISKSATLSGLLAQHFFCIMFFFVFFFFGSAKPHAIYKILHYITYRHRPRKSANEFCHCICFRIAVCVCAVCCVCVSLCFESVCVGAWRTWRMRNFSYGSFTRTSSGILLSQLV